MVGQWVGAEWLCVLAIVTATPIVAGIAEVGGQLSGWGLAQPHSVLRQSGRTMAGMAMPIRAFASNRSTTYTATSFGSLCAFAKELTCLGAGGRLRHAALMLCSACAQKKRPETRLPGMVAGHCRRALKGFQFVQKAPTLTPV